MVPHHCAPGFTGREAAARRPSRRRPSTLRDLRRANLPRGAGVGSRRAAFSCSRGGSPEECFGGALLHEFSPIHDDGSVADVTYHFEVVGDDEDCESHTLLNLGEKIEQLALDGEIETRSGFVGHHQFRRRRERSRHADPAGLAAAQLVRVALDEGRIQADELEQANRRRTSGSDPCGRTGGALSTGEIMVLRRPLRPFITP